ncbi:hypothetical protein A9D14_13225 [Croceicoccus marinus]|uniref:Uncharacterized protein n=1 Tax=Croceicoccus marinus TaxID=450378 RepID=A0A1Z1FE22_9SPHN|nr:hypothetical protein A9D14_13225 [Croceicoccus marinus]
MPESAQAGNGGSESAEQRAAPGNVIGRLLDDSPDGRYARRFPGKLPVRGRAGITEFFESEL